MDENLDRRTYDVLRLVEQHGPIGSIRLVDLMQRHGYSIKDRTVRLILSDLDERGLTTKVPGKGRTLTERGERELRRGNVAGRLERVRTRIATMTSQVSYDPADDTGSLVVSSATVHDEDLGEALSCLERLDDTPFGPIPVAVTELPGPDPDRRRLLIPSSITLDGVLLTHGINAELRTAGVVEYDPTGARSGLGRDGEIGDDEREIPPDDAGGAIRRYVDVINGEGSSIDVISLLIETARTTVTPVTDGDMGFLVADDRTVPLSRLGEARDLSVATRNTLGGVIKVERPREGEHASGRDLPWGFGSVTYAGTGELALGALHESGLIDEWNTLYGVEDRTAFESVRVLSADVLPP